MARVFLSHSSADNVRAKTIREWLVEQGHEVFLDFDREDGIAPVDLWKERLYERLRWADALVCVLTATYNTSQWCFGEVVAARALGCPVVPLIAEPGEQHPLLGDVA